MSADPATTFQGKLMLAAEQNDISLITTAFTKLRDSEGHYECFGDTVGGASACYIACVGDATDQKRLIKILDENSATLELARTGLWDATVDVALTLAKVFDISRPEQRLDTLEILDIRASEGENVGKIIDEIFSKTLTPKETALIRKTAIGDHWAWVQP